LLRPLNIKLEVGGGPVGLKEALDDALIFEQQALDAYAAMLPRVEGALGLEDFIHTQIATETEHVQEIAMLLE
jgi:rubrerythrin